MRIAICDDEEVQRIVLEKYLKEWAEAKKILLNTIHFCDAESFLFSWEDDKDYDLLLLDIEMNHINGMQLAMQLRAQGYDVPVLFITGYDSYMSQGYEVSALHYLLKPVQKEKLFGVLDKLECRKKTEKKLLFRMEEGLLSIAEENIWYVEASGHQCILCGDEKRYVLKSSIGEVKKQLDDEMFVGCHRSYIVNLQRISAIMKNELVMDNGVRIPISRGMLKQVNELFIRNCRV